MSDKELYIYIVNRIKYKFSFLYNLKYQVEFVDYEFYNEYSKGNDFKIKFGNNDIHRYLEFRYFRRDAKGGFSNILDLWIKNGDGQSSFLINSYMLFIQKQEIKYLWLDSFDGTFEEKLDQLLDYVVNILQAYLIPVLKGEEWVDVPTNWYGAR
jgi:hypothetical protein